MNTLNERIKKLRKGLDLTQQEFADKLSIKRNTVATYETGKSNPSDAAVILICKTFNVSETWLRTGEGEMFVEAPSDTLDALAREYGLDRFGRAVIEKMVNLNEKQWELLSDMVTGIVSDLSDDLAPAFAPAHIPTIEEEARAEAKEYYRQRLMEKKQEAASSVSQSDTGSGGKKMA